MKLAKKGFLICVGLGALTREKAEKIVNQLIKKGQLHESEGKKLLKDLITESLKEKVRLRKEVLTEAKKAAKEILKVSRSELRRLATKIKSLEKEKRKVKKKK